MSDLAEKLKKKYQVLNSQSNVKSPETGLDMYISNVVCSYSVRCHLNLKRIAMQGMHVEYRRENNMVNMRLRKPMSTASIWSSGKITCTGATTELDAYKAARRICRQLQKMNFKVRLANYRVVNVLATSSANFDIDLNKLADQYRQECSYEPELHPGATFRIKQYKCTLKLFTTGSITLTAPNVHNAQKSIDFIYPILVECRRQSSQPTPKQDNYLVTTPLTITNPVCLNAPTIINLNKNDNYLTSSSSSLSNDSFTSTMPASLNTTNNLNSFSLQTINHPHYYTNHNFSHFNHLNHHNHFYADNLIIDNVYEDFLQ